MEGSNWVGYLLKSETIVSWLDKWLNSADSYKKCKPDFGLLASKNN